MHINIYHREPDTILAPQGRIDTLSSPKFEEALTPLVTTQDFNLIIDFAGVDYISSAALRVLLIGAQKAKGLNGNLVLENLNESVKQVLDITGFTPLFNIR